MLRDPVGQFISLYKHRAKAGSVGSIDNWREPVMTSPLRLGGLRRQITSIPAKVVVRGYGKESGANWGACFSRTDWLRVAVPKEIEGFSSSNLLNPVGAGTATQVTLGITRVWCPSCHERLAGLRSRP